MERLRQRKFLWRRQCFRLLCGGEKQGLSFEVIDRYQRIENDNGDQGGFRHRNIRDVVEVKNDDYI